MSQHVLQQKAYTFFYGKSPFSQWHPSKFTIEGREFTCAEQYMMFAKAEAFVDQATAEAIMTTDVPWQHKRLGRQVKNFNEDVWKAIRERVVMKGSRAKFTQNLDLCDALLATAGTMLVEASSYDQIWGIGLGMDDPKKEDPNNWRGLNLLGKILTELREDLKNETV